MGYTMSRGNSGVKFKDLGSSPAKGGGMDFDTGPMGGGGPVGGPGTGTGSGGIVTKPGGYVVPGSNVAPLRKTGKHFLEKDLAGPVATEKKTDQEKEEKENELKHKVEAKMDHVRGIFRQDYIEKK